MPRLDTPALDAENATRCTSKELYETENPIALTGAELRMTESPLVGVTPGTIFPTFTCTFRIKPETCHASAARPPRSYPGMRLPEPRPARHAQDHHGRGQVATWRMEASA